MLNQNTGYTYLHLLSFAFQLIIWMLASRLYLAKFTTCFYKNSTWCVKKNPISNTSIISYVQPDQSYQNLIKKKKINIFYLWFYIPKIFFFFFLFKYVLRDLGTVLVKNFTHSKLTKVTKINMTSMSQQSKNGLSIFFWFM